MTQPILVTKDMPFCPGCGHGVAVKNLAKALEEAGFRPLDVIIVSDIGCAGLVDPILATHTIHGLHGRAPALALGVSLGLSNPGKKVVAIQGDGGATIGLQHLLEAARRNVDMVLIVLNNLLYGMTGGQMSGLSTQAFKAEKHVDDDTPPFDIVRLAHEAGAAGSARISAPGEFKAYFQEALATPGFSLIEVACLCPSHGVKKLKELAEVIPGDLKLSRQRPPARASYRDTGPLFEKGGPLPAPYSSCIRERLGIVIAGSAGGGVQSVARLVANAGIRSGLHATMKGEYPITVGTGFSLAEVILSRNRIHYTGLEAPDVIVAVTEDGMAKARSRVKPNTALVLDSALRDAAFPDALYGNFHKEAGKQGAALAAAASWLIREGLLEREALLEAARGHQHGEALMEVIEKAAGMVRGLPV
ncbi:MAG: 2-oxoacid:acceptor oxidoreductase family protein [Lewinellaceae bacterium]|nr:2-oxoacid:acceptor oxidoreductase family protein [Lewinellaceae bacterium]